MGYFLDDEEFVFPSSDLCFVNNSTGLVPQILYDISDYTPGLKKELQMIWGVSGAEVTRKISGDSSHSYDATDLKLLIGVRNYIYNYIYSLCEDKDFFLLLCYNFCLNEDEYSVETQAWKKSKDMLSEIKINEYGNKKLMDICLAASYFSELQNNNELYVLSMESLAKYNYYMLMRQIILKDKNDSILIPGAELLKKLYEFKNALYEKRIEEYSVFENTLLYEDKNEIAKMLNISYSKYTSVISKKSNDLECWGKISDNVRSIIEDKLGGGEYFDKEFDFRFIINIESCSLNRLQLLFLLRLKTFIFEFDHENIFWFKKLTNDEFWYGIHYIEETNEWFNGLKTNYKNFIVKHKECILSFVSNCYKQDYNLGYLCVKKVKENIIKEPIITNMKMEIYNNDGWILNDKYMMKKISCYFDMFFDLDNKDNGDTVTAKRGYTDRELKLEFDRCVGARLKSEEWFLDTIQMLMEFDKDSWMQVLILDLYYNIFGAEKILNILKR